MKNLLLLFVIGLVQLALARVAISQEPEPVAETHSVKAMQSEELAAELRDSSTAPSPAGIYAAGRWRTGLSLGMASVNGFTYTTAGGGAGYQVLNGLELGASVRGWFSSAPTVLEVTPEVRYVAWQLPGFKPYAGAFYRWNSSSDVAIANSYGGRLGVLYNKSNSRLYLGAGLVWEQLAGNSAVGLSRRSLVYPELVLSAGPVVVSASKAPRF